MSDESKVRNHRVTHEDEEKVIEYVEASELADKLELPGQPIDVDLAGMNFGFVIPKGGGDDE